MNPEFIKVDLSDGYVLAIRSSAIVSIAGSADPRSTTIWYVLGTKVMEQPVLNTLADIEAQMYPVLWVNGIGS